MSAVLSLTAACVSDPIIIRADAPQAPAVRPAPAKVEAQEAVKQVAAPNDLPAIEEDAPQVPDAMPSPAEVTAEEATDEVVIPKGWSWVTSPQGKFGVAFPSTPNVKERLVKTPAGNATAIIYSVPIGKNGGSMGVVVAQSIHVTNGLTADEVMRRAFAKTMADYTLTQLSEERVIVNGARGSGETFPGIDIEAIQTSSRMRVSLRIIMVHERLYQLLYLRDGEKTEPFQQFVSTFELQ
ncbi:hypothetical protein [Corallococcus exercitus]|uniref:hypothetical protein n=1 Tax=Corallococcus exercitus TaxID=2316736 RepID=UPI001ABF8E34|nr:hypothetical protein [Corallococcus exercitus]